MNNDAPLINLDKINNLAMMLVSGDEEAEQVALEIFYNLAKGHIHHLLGAVEAPSLSTQESAISYLETFHAFIGQKLEDIKNDRA